jgi:hypothetical protein
MGTQVMRNSVIGTFLIAVFLTASMPAEILWAEGTAQSVIVEKDNRCKSCKAATFGKQCSKDRCTNQYSENKNTPCAKQKKSYRKLYIIAGTVIAAGIVSYYRLQPDHQPRRP